MGHYTCENFEIICFLSKYCSCIRKRIHSQRHYLRELRRPEQTPSSCFTQRRRFLGFLSMQLRCLPGHALRSLPPPILPRMRHLRHHRLHLWKRSRRIPEQQPLRPPTQRQPAEHLHRPGKRRSESEHRDFHPELQSRRRRRSDPRSIAI